jgi:tRNA (guanine9-N1)-methyltransferase
MEIMLRWLEDGDWGKAFMRVIPKRKEARLKGFPENSGAVEHGKENSRRDLPSSEDAKAGAGQG